MKNKIKSSNKMRGTYLVCFKKPEKDLSGNLLFGNDYMEASVEPIHNRLFVKWINGMDAKIDHKYLLFKKYENLS